MALLRRLCTLALLLLPAAGPAWGAANLLNNPEFDATATPWSISFGPGGSAGFSSVDSDDCALSGSVLFDVAAPDAEATLKQCVALPPGQPPLRARIRLRTEGSNALVQFVLVLYGSGSPCLGPVVGTAYGPFGSPTLDSWTTFRTAQLSPPEDAVYASLQLYLESGASFTIRSDRAFLGDGTEIFSEDFEIGDSCRFPFNES